MKKFLLPLLATAILFPARIHAGAGIFERPPEEWSEQYFTRPFHAEFTVDASRKKHFNGEIFFIFSRDGLALLFHDSGRPVYECYSYETNGKTISMKGICTLKQDVLNFRKLETLPDDIRLQFSGYGENATLHGQDSGGITYNLDNMTEGYIDRLYRGADLNRIIASIDAGSKWNRGTLWYVDSGYGTPAVTATYDGRALKSFPDGAIISGIPDPEDPRYILVDYIKGQQLYVDTHDLRKIENDGQLDRILYNDASAYMPFFEWTGSFEEKTRKIDSSGYLNGWKAGRKTAVAFLPLLVIFTILLVLNKLFPDEPYPGALYHITSAILMMTTVFEIWYTISLKTDFLWFIFDPETFVHGLAAAVGTLFFICFHLDLILIIHKDLAVFNETYSRYPFWLETVLAALALAAGIPLALFGPATAGIGAYCLLAAASLPRTIGYMSHSSRRTPILPFMLLCYPVKYILFFPLAILYFLQEADKYKVTFTRTEDPDHKVVTDMNGNTQFLTRLSGNTYMDNNGRTYIESGGSFYPGRLSDNDGPYR